MKNIELRTQDIQREKSLSNKLFSYFENRFLAKEKKTYDGFLDENESYISFWRKNQEKLLTPLDGLLFLKNCFPQLNFSIHENTRRHSLYRTAVSRGNLDFVEISENRIDLQADGISVKLHESFCGTIPIIKIDRKEDFEKIIQSLLHQNKPVEIPKSMGAAMINGIINWEKIKTIKNKFLERNFIYGWKAYFNEEVLPFPYRYKDRIIILSSGYYSNIHPKEVEMSINEWVELSYQIRLVHECTHLYTLQRYGVASNNLHDELIADYIGLLAAIGVYNKKWMLLFMGLGEYPNYRIGARLENYIEDLKVDSKDFSKLTDIIFSSIENIALFEQKIAAPITPKTLRIRVETLCETDLEVIASSFGAESLYSKYKDICQTYD